VLTILDMQPRQTGGGTGKSSDMIVYEMAADILDKVVDKLDTDDARPDMFEVSHNHSLASRHSRLTPATNEEHRYQRCWTNCGRYDQSADDIC